MSSAAIYVKTQRHVRSRPALISVAAVAEGASMVSQTGTSLCANCAEQIPKQVRDLIEVALDARVAAGLQGSP